MCEWQSLVHFTSSLSFFSLINKYINKQLCLLPRSYKNKPNSHHQCTVFRKFWLNFLCHSCATGSLTAIAIYLFSPVKTPIMCNGCMGRGCAGRHVRTVGGHAGRLANHFIRTKWNYWLGSFRPATATDIRRFFFLLSEHLIYWLLLNSVKRFSTNITLKAKKITYQPLALTDIFDVRVSAAHSSLKCNRHWPCPVCWRIIQSVVHGN